MTTKTPTTAQRITEMRAELIELEGQVSAASSELAGIAYLAEIGNREAQQRRAELLGVRGAAEHRAAELRQAITSGEWHHQREQREAAEVERKLWAKKAEEFRSAQVEAARRVDAALRELEAAHVAYLAATDERGSAVRRSGGEWSNFQVMSHLVRAVFHHCPQVATHLRLERVQRANASSMEGMVR